MPTEKRTPHLNSRPLFSYKNTGSETYSQTEIGEKNFFLGNRKKHTDNETWESQNLKVAFRIVTLK